MKHVVICLFFVCAFFSSALAKENSDKVAADPVFDEKMVMCEIDFLPDSYTLTEQAKLVLNSVVNQLESIDTKLKVIRIEGYFGPQDNATDALQLSMLRALAVEDYFRINLSVRFERYLTGHNKANADCCAQIAVYDNPWQVATDPVQVTDRDKIDGPS